MKNTFILNLLVLSFCLIFIFSSSNALKAQEEKSDRKELQLKGVVKTMEVNPSPNGAGFIEAYVFNKAGNILEQSSLYPLDKRAYTRTVNFYDEIGRKISAESFKKGKLEGKSNFIADEKGNIIEQTDYDAGGKLISKTTLKYDEKNNLIERTFNLIEPVPSSFLIISVPPGEYKIIYSMDENGNPKQIQSLLSNKKAFPDETITLSEQRFVYNRENQKVEESEVSNTYKNLPPRIQTNFYTYNKQGNIVEIRNYESIKESYVEEVRDKFKVIDSKGTVQNGLLISDKPFMILWGITICDYEYDSKDNWTKQTCKGKFRESENFALVNEPRRRIITYF